VLQQMSRSGLITPAERQAAAAAPLHLAEQGDASTKAPYFVAVVMDFLERHLGAATLYRSGLTVYTTLNYAMQQAAERAVTQGLQGLAARMKKGGLLQQEYPQAALVCLGASRGAILAMVGGRSFDESRFNRATMARRQPGSAFKPMIYALAVEKGFRQNDILWDAPVTYPGARENAAWSPENFSGIFHGEVTLRTALALSQNIPAVKLLHKLGPTRAVEFAHRMGINSPLDANLSLALGTSEVTLLELTAAYGVFPNEGVWTRPFGITEVLDREGRSLWREKPQRRPAISPETAAITTDMLKAVVLEGTGRAARRIGRPLGGKTGTTDGYKDAWFLGFSPTIVTGVWVGLDHHGSLGDKETGAKAALPIWIHFMEQVLSGQPYHDFALPEGVVKVHIDAESGLLAPENCAHALWAVFKKGTGPKQYSRSGSEGPWGAL
jgi:penicillin-binding protein 1A